MADWKDFVEDNKERVGQLLDSLEQRFRSTKNTVPLPTPPRYCPVCLDSFYSDDSLDDHIRQVHGPQHVYLRVNGSIVRDIGWAERGIQSICVVLLGHSSAKVEVDAGGTHNVLTGETERSLLRQIPNGFEGE